MKIEPGIGIGPVIYGMTEEELVQLMGKPDRVEESEYVEGAGDWHRELWYSHRNISFTFNEDDSYRLGTITIMGSGYTLFGRDLFNSPKKLVKSHIVKKSNEIPKIEDYSSDLKEPHECFDHDGLGIIFWFDSDNLSEMQCGYFFESDNETIIWPERS